MQAIIIAQIWSYLLSYKFEENVKDQVVNRLQNAFSVILT